MITHPDTTRAAAEAQLAKRSNAAARQAGWYAVDWRSKERAQDIARQNALKSVAARGAKVRDAILALVGVDWTPVNSIVASHQMDHPTRSTDAIKGQLRDAEVAGMIEGRLRKSPVTGQSTKEYRRARG